MNQDKYIYFIYQELQDGLSASESKELQEWLAQSPENEKIKADIVQSLQVVDQLNPTFDIDVESDYQLVRNKLDLQDTTTSTAPNPGRNKRILVYFLILAFGIGMLYYLISSQDAPPAQMFAKHTKAGEKLELLLEDGTVVHLNEQSSLEYPSNFEGDLRSVTLTGEAYFDVAKMESNPFIISTAHAEVEVLGTAFNVNASDNNSSVTVTVERGKVQLSNLSHMESVILTAHEQGILNKEDQSVREMKLDNLNALAWKSYELSFKNTLLKDVFETLETAFSVNINYHSEIADCRYSMTKREVVLDEILTNLASLYKFEIEKVEASNYSLIGGICN